MFIKRIYIPGGKKKSWSAWGTSMKLSWIKFKAHNPCPLFLHFHATSSGERKNQTSLHSNRQVTWLSYSGGKVPELFSRSSCSKNKRKIQSQLGGRRPLAQNSSYTMSSSAERDNENGYMSTIPARHSNCEEY